MRWLLFFCGGLMLYRSASNCMLIDDALSGIWEIKTNAGGGFTRCYGFASLYYVHFAFLHLFYNLCDLVSTRWFLIFMALHALNTNLLFQFADRFGQLFQWPKSFAIIGTLLFFSSPFFSENIIWAATQHYAIAMSIFLFQCAAIVKLKSINVQFIVLQSLLYAIALLTLEVALLFPLIYLLLAYVVQGQSASFSLKAYVIKVLLWQVLLVGLSFALLYAVHGAVLPHGADQHNINPFSSQALNYWAKMLGKLLLYLPYWPFTEKMKVFSWISSSLLICASLAIVPFLPLLWVNQKNKHAYLFICFSALLLSLPFLNRYFIELIKLENDRHYYFAATFLYLGLAYVISRLSRFAWLLVVIILSIHFICIQKNISLRVQGQQLHDQFVKAYPPQNNKTTYLLNVPAYNQDAMVFRDDSRFPISYYMLKGKKIDSLFRPICGYMGQGVRDEFGYTIMPDSSVYVNIKTPGVWLVRNYMGASNYETDDYVFSTQQWGFAVKFKRQLKSNEQILLFNKGRFEIIKSDSL